MKKMKKARKSNRVVSSRTVYRGPAFSVTSEMVREPGGIVARRDIVRHPGSVVVLAVDARGRVLLERQYRHAAESHLWELPAGRVDPGESVLAAGRRELLEETGYRAASWKRILHFLVSPGFLDEAMTVYLAEGLRAGPVQMEDDENIAVHFVPLGRALRMVESGKIRDAKCIAALLWLARDRRS